MSKAKVIKEIEAIFRKERWRDRLGKVPNWMTLAKIQRFKVVKTMYIWLFVVPVVARILEKVNDVANVTIWGCQFELQIGLPFTWKLFYFSALCFTFASLIAHFRCYKLIKDHVNYSDFVQSGKGYDQLFEYIKEYHDSNKNDILKSQQETIRATVASQLSPEEYLKKTYWSILKSMDSHRACSRFFCSVFYLAGFGLMAYVFGENFYYVVKVLF